MTGVRVGDIRKVAVVGAGPGGLLTANALAAKGFAVDVYEQAPKFERVGAGIQLSANATAAFAPLGLLDKLLPYAVTPKWSESYRHDTGELIQRTPLRGTDYPTPYCQVHRADLHRVLVHSLPDGAVHTGKELVDLRQDSKGVTLQFADGSEAQADFVVGADGLHSRVQRCLFGERPISFSGWASHRGVLPRAAVEDLNIDTVAAKYMANDRHLVHYYINGGNELTFIAVLPQAHGTEEGWTRKSEKADVLAALHGFHPRILELVHRVEEIGKWALWDRDVFFSWSSGRVTLLGDAVHPMRPFMGQGGAMALEDAAMLARALSALPPEAPLVDALAIYEYNRKPRATWVQMASRTHGFRSSKYENAPHPAHWLYSYDPWNDPLVLPKGMAFAPKEDAR